TREDTGNMDIVKDMVFLPRDQRGFRLTGKSVMDINFNTDTFKIKEVVMRISSSNFFYNER
ncbi:MAG: hypothetical protein WC294_06690, partial [Methanoregula sp.]